MTDITIYHNPKCGTSRNTLAMIRHSGVEPRVVLYPETPPTRAPYQPDRVTLMNIARFVLVVLVVIGFNPVALAQDYWGQNLLKSPANFIFGYGSLISSKSRNSSVAVPIPAIPVRVSASFGYIRTWNDRSPTGFTALGLRKPHQDEKPASINGVLFPVEGDDMVAYDKREEGYVRLEIPREKIEALSWQGVPRQGKIWVYVPAVEGKEPGVGLPGATMGFPLLQSYVDVVIEGALEYGVDYAKELVQTTRDWEPFWLNDRILARRPWVAEKQYARIDGFLTAIPAYQARMLPEQFSARLALDMMRQGATAPAH